MKPGYLNELSASFYLFLDNWLLREGEAFFNHSGELEYSFDPNFKNFKVYGSEYRQWVADTDISGAIIPSGIISGSTFIEKSPSDVRIDYGMGRAILKNSYPSNSNVFSAAFSAKEFNIYPTTKDEIDLLFERADVKGEKIKSTNRALNYKDQPYPAIFIKFNGGSNKPLAFGGIDEADWDVRCTIVSDSAYKLDAILSTISDAANKSFKFISSENLPFNPYGDIKAPNFLYSYSSTCASQSGGNWIYVKSVDISKFSEKVNKSIKDNVWGAFADFRLLGLKKI